MATWLHATRVRCMTKSPPAIFAAVISQPRGLSSTVGGASVWTTAAGGPELVARCVWAVHCSPSHQRISRAVSGSEYQPGGGVIMSSWILSSDNYPDWIRRRYTEELRCASLPERAVRTLDNVQPFGCILGS